jgi:capsular polysaccharide biosynthesis protein
MATKTKPEDLPDLDAEREVDLRSYWMRIAEHWWLPLVGLAAGLVIGYLISLGGNQVYKAKAVVYLGQPLSASGVPIQSQATNPSTVRVIVTSEATIDSVARKVGLKPSQLRGHISTQAVSGNITRLGQNPLVSISVTGSLRGKAAHAANELAKAVKNSPALANYSNTKITTLSALVANEQSALNSLGKNIEAQQAAGNAAGLSTTDRLILSNTLNGLIQQRLVTVQQLTTNQQLLALAKDVEAPKVTTRAVAVKTTARSRRNTVLVAGLIGLILGGIAALLYEPTLKVVRRHS